MNPQYFGPVDPAVDTPCRYWNQVVVIASVVFGGPIYASPRVLATCQSSLKRMGQA